METKYKNQIGFTLIEVTLVIVIIGIISISIMGFFGNSAGIIKSVDIREKAIFLAQNEIETLKASNWDDIATNSDVITEIAKYGLNNYPEYTKIIEVESEDINDDEENDVKKITVTIQWHNDNSVLIKTKIAKR